MDASEPLRILLRSAASRIAASPFASLLANDAPEQSATVVAASRCAACFHVTFR